MSLPFKYGISPVFSYLAKAINKPAPTDDEGESAHGSYHSKPSCTRQGKDVEATGKKDDPYEETKTGGIKINILEMMLENAYGQ